MSASRARSFETRDDGSGVLPSPRAIRVLVVGGLTRLDAHYRAAPAGVEIDTVNADGGSLETRAAAADAIVLVVGNVSHAAAAKVRSIARRRGTPLASATGASVSRVRAAIALAFVAARDGEGLGVDTTLRLA
ncbi:MAG: DUF2325 domain-containing protein [Labilithrix sp.]|nr:DUF2325 domain-containing protein [Labilithrix sp.]